MDTKNFKKEMINGIKYALFIFIIMLLIWYIWAEFIYRWSDERIAEIIARKYLSENLSSLEKDTEFIAKKIHVASDKTYATAIVQLRHKATLGVLYETPVYYKITPDCSIFDFKCILV